MEYRLADLLDIPKLQALFDSFDKLHQLPSAVIDIDGNILTATAWQDICTKFHRMNPQSEKECIESDTYLVSELSEGKTQVVYKCPKGLVDTATPIVVDGKHLGNAFTGQFFLEPPDEGHFRSLAHKYGFDEEAYIEAMRKVPIITEDKHRKNLEVLAKLTEILAEMGLQQKRRIETEQALRESRETFKALVEFNEAIHWEFDLIEGRFTYVSPQADKMTGYLPGDWTDFDSWSNMVHPDDRKWAVDFYLTQIKEKKDHDFIYRIITKQGEVKWLRDIVKVVLSDNVPVKLIGVMFDITQLKEAEREKEVLLKEVHHRVKNNMAVISAMLSLQARHLKDDKCLELMKESQGRIKSMALVHEALYKSEDFAHINVQDYIDSLVQHISGSHHATMGRIKIIKHIDDISIDLDTLVPCGLIINELISNAYKHAFKNREDGEIRISLKAHESDMTSLAISDNGSGLPGGFDINQSQSLGLLIASSLVTQIRGNMEIDNEHQGVSYTITFPNKLTFAGRAI